MPIKERCATLRVRTRARAVKKLREEMPPTRVEILRVRMAFRLERTQFRKKAALPYRTR